MRGALTRLPEFRGGTILDPASLVPFERASGPVRMTPAACVQPRDVDDVSMLLSWAGREGEAVIPRGAGTGMPGGNVGPGISLDLSKSFTAVGAPSRDEGTIEVGAGAVAARIEEVARSAGYFLPPLPSSAQRCTIGGMVANNAAGARTYKYGAVRDWVRGLTVVLADGTQHRLTADQPAPDPFKALLPSLRAEIGSDTPLWPNVRKNSSGYALDRYMPGGDPVQLLIGSEGTLAVVTSVTLALAPIPVATGLALVAIRDLVDIPLVLERAAEMNASSCELFGRRFLEITSLSEHPLVGTTVSDAVAAFLIEVDGSPQAVAEGLEALRGLARELGSAPITAVDEAERDALWKIRHAASPLVAACAERGLVSTQIVEDSVVPPENLGQYLTELDVILSRWETDAVVFGHAGDANVHVNPLLDVNHRAWRARARGILADTAELVAHLGGTLAGEHGDGRIRAPLLERVWGSPMTRTFRRVKETLDPGGILNPGVILPLPGQDPLEGLWPQYGG